MVFWRNVFFVFLVFLFLFFIEFEEGCVLLNLEGVYLFVDKLVGRLVRVRVRMMNLFFSERDWYDWYKSKRGRDGICLMLRVVRVVVYYNSYSVDK